MSKTLFDSKLYPWYTVHSTLEEAVQFALELEGYKVLWDNIILADKLGVICAN